jgi:hypothetical protein
MPAFVSLSEIGAGLATTAVCVALVCIFLAIGIGLERLCKLLPKRNRAAPAPIKAPEWDAEPAWVKTQRESYARWHAKQRVIGRLKLGFLLIIGIPLLLVGAVLVVRDLLTMPSFEAMISIGIVIILFRLNSLEAGITRLEAGITRLEAGITRLEARATRND